ncbi:hypothetical protein CRG98_043442 [Punica granatum]|uniref:Uncharacterized protein n=1 Tax=Punica granatum TaxID=22663 RepID=A0A2I0HWU2_PUNGR|nr:hypothetical protein CRG98_043442 [Punica granatum]
MNLRCTKVSSHGLADRARLQAARARWLGELAVQEMKLTRVSRPGKVARGTSEVARRTCKTGQGCKRHERGGSANLRFKKVNSHGLAELARLQEARARWFGELAVQESKLARVSRPGKFAKGTTEVVRRTCGARKKVISHGIADPARLQEARARWLVEFAVQKTKLTQTWQGCKRHERGGSANLRFKKVNSHGLAELARLQEARARHERGGLANLRCKKWNWLGLADLARLQEARARWLGEHAVQEGKLARVGRPDKVAKSTGEVARRTCEAGK